MQPCIAFVLYRKLLAVWWLRNAERSCKGTSEVCALFGSCCFSIVIEPQNAAMEDSI